MKPQRTRGRQDKPSDSKQLTCSALAVKRQKHRRDKLSGVSTTTDEKVERRRDKLSGVQTKRYHGCKRLQPDSQAEPIFTTTLYCHASNFFPSIGFTPPVGGPIVDLTRPGSEIHDTAGTTITTASNSVSGSTFLLQALSRVPCSP